MPTRTTTTRSSASWLTRALGIAALTGLGLSAAALAPQQAEASQFLSLYHRPDLKWYTIETEHFLVHYPVSRKGPDKTEHYMSGEWAARKVAKVSEQYWEPMCAEFDYYLEEKVHIVVLEQYDQLQGFTIPNRNWVEISGNPGGSFYRSRGRSEWFSNVLVHEFAHVVSLKKNQSSGENLQVTVLDALYQNNAIATGPSDVDMGVGGSYYVSDRGEPWWWTEGGAEYWSSRTGYNWWSSGRDRHVRNTILEDRALTYDQWKTTQLAMSYGDGERGYQQGHSMALYMRIRFGEEAFADFAKESDRKYRATWETIIEEKTGVPPRELYDDWKAWVEDYYQRWYADIVAEGEVKGMELETRPLDVHWNTPSQRDQFFTGEKKLLGKTTKEPKKWQQWEGEKDATGRADVFPKFSDDGEWFAQAYGYGHLYIAKAPESLYPAATMGSPAGEGQEEAQGEVGRMSMRIPMAFYSNYDFVPGKDQLVISMQEDQIHRARMNFRAIRVETDGYDWNELVLVDLATRTETEPDGPVGSDREAEVTYLRPEKVKGSFTDGTWRSKPGLQFSVIPNTKRGTDPAISPDGKQIAYIEYGDGTHNLVLINIDGTGKTYLTEFESGEMLQSVDWSPDGKTLAFALFKNYQADIWLMDVATKEVTALNQDASEELDVHWSAHDGNLYFVSDESSIYNVYRYDFDSKKVQQLTNVISTAYTPHLTPRGDLMYTNWTAFGEKNYIVAKDEFLEQDATDRFGLSYDEERAEAYYAYTEDLSEYEALTTRYNSLQRFHPPALIPIFRLRNPSLPTFQLETGLQMSTFDVGEKHSVLLYGMVGTSYQLTARYTYQGWHPTISFGYAHRQGKSDIGFLIDNDNDSTTTDDQKVYEFRQNTVSNTFFMFANYPLNQRLQLNASLVAFDFGFRSRNNLKFPRFNQGVVGSVGLEFSTLPYGLQTGRMAFSPYGINPRGRYITLNYSHGYTDHVSPSNNGVNTDDGERLDDYNYNSVRFRWTEHMGFPFSRKWRGMGHSLQLDAQGGVIDRNVQLFDELRGGGVWPQDAYLGAILPLGGPGLIRGLLHHSCHGAAS